MPGGIGSGITFSVIDSIIFSFFIINPKGCLTFLFFSFSNCQHGWMFGFNGWFVTRERWTWYFSVSIFLLNSRGGSSISTCRAARDVSCKAPAHIRRDMYCIEFNTFLELSLAESYASHP